ncbi:MAG: hypothetical protein V1921_04140 [Candidatus Altiarchaeota archaeon]
MEKKRYYAMAIVVLYLLPAFVTIIPPGSQYNPTSKIAIDVHRPYIFSGDEPHYLVMVDSIIRDRDLRVRNNYQIAAESHVKTKYHPFFITLEDYHTSEENLDYSFHPYIIPFLASLVLWPFYLVHQLEAGAVLLSIAVSIMGVYYTYKLLNHFDKHNAMLITVAIALGTPILNYSKTFFKEPYLLAFLSLSYYVFFAKKRNLIAGILIGICFLTRPVYLVFSLLIFERIARKDYNGGLNFILPIAASVLILLLSNYVTYGNVYARYGVFFKTSFLRGIPFFLILVGAIFYIPTLFRNRLKDFTEFYSRNHLYVHILLFIFTVIWIVNVEGLRTMLLSARKGLLVYSPFAVFSLFGLVDLQYTDRQISKYIAVPTILYVILLSYVHFDTGYSFSSRFMVPILPLLSINLLYWYRDRGTYMKAMFIMLVAASITINILAAFTYQAAVWDRTPIEVIFSFIENK